MQIVHRYGDVIAEKYQIIDILGQGGSCTTYAVQDLTSNQKIALKSLSLHWVKDWKVVELFEREGNILSRLDHPTIPRYLEYFYIDTPDNRSFYIAQQVAPGKSLAFRVEQSWRTTEQEVKDIAIQILEVLKYLHGLTPPVVHRDIKPQNIIRGDDGKVFLVDFGAVQQTYHNTFMRGSTVVGTYGYMAPEQFRSQAVPATDLYGLAATLLYLLTHRSPADLPSDGLKIDVCSCVKVSEHFTAWLEKMLELDLEQRFGSATEALEALLYKHPIKSNKIVKKPKTTLKLLLATASITGAVYSINLLSTYRLEVLTKLGFSNFINTISLNQAIENADEKLIKTLISGGVDVNAKNYFGETPLHVVKDIEMAKLLISKGANVNAKDKAGNTPVYKRISDSNKPIVELLIQNGADVNAKNENGETPLHIAQKAELGESIKNLLLENGANPNIKDNRGLTAIQNSKNSEVRKKHH